MAIVRRNGNDIRGAVTELDALISTTRFRDNAIVENAAIEFSTSVHRP